MQASQSFVFDAFHLDLHDERLWRGQERLPLHPKTLAVLGCLVTQAGQLVTKDALLAAVWPATAVSESVVTVAIRQLRRALGDQARTPRFIETVHGRGYRFIAPLSAPAAPGGSPLRPLPLFRLPPYFVGRDAALAQLAQWWTVARDGTRQVGIIAGEPGIGKTALVEAFVAQGAAGGDCWVAHGQCSEPYGPGEPYRPVLEALGRLGRDREGAQLVAVLRQYAPSWLVQMPALLPPAEWEALQRTLGHTGEPRMLRELTDALDALTTVRPLVLVLEDLHWSDRATLAWLAAVARRPDPARLLILGTYRPVDALVHARPLRALLTELRQHGQCVELALDSLSDDAVTAYLGQRFRSPAWAGALARVLQQRTNGNPLFLLAVVDELVRQHVVTEGPAGWDLQDGVETILTIVPAHLQALIEHQLAACSPADQTLLAVASVAGIAFAAATVAAGLMQTDEVVEARCTALAQQGRFLQAHGGAAWPDGTVTACYRFRHALYQDVVYQRLPAGRQSQWHARMGTRLVHGFGTEGGDMAVTIAHHCLRGRLWPQAVQYLGQAGQQASDRSANVEAISHLTTGIELLKTLPATPEHTQQALTLYIALGAALRMAKGMGAPEVEHAYTQAYALCQQAGETPELVPVLLGLFGFYTGRSQFHTARELGETLLRLTQRDHNPALAVLAHYTLGQTQLYRGALSAARLHLEDVIARYTPAQHRALVFRMGRDPVVRSRIFATLALWHLGCPAQALARRHDALTLAHALGSPHSLAQARCWAAYVSQFCRDMPAVHRQAEAAVALATEKGFPFWGAAGTILRGWALVIQGQGEAGLAEGRPEIAAYRGTEATLLDPYYCSLLADVHARLGQTADGPQALAEAHTLVEQNEERWWEAEIYRLGGVVLLRQPGTPQAEAEAWLQRALDVARHQEAKSLELRAAMSLSRLWQQQGKQAEARELLASVYGWFTEGFDTADLLEAKVLLEEFAR